MTNRLIVRTESQKILMEKELQGQISDGVWENYDTDSRLWDCDVKVIEVGEKLGCNFTPKCFLDFCDAMEYLDERMLEYVKVDYPFYNMDDLLEDLMELTIIVFGK